LTNRHSSVETSSSNCAPWRVGAKSNKQRRNKKILDACGVKDDNFMSKNP
jgi:hypothetical protein